ncbi:MAG: TetR/AcrR family transcriptional regulator [Desulfobacteraceae bacterium]|nr:TetR/AcrR family transcriptional regulator [Desulfobacteraceae bacterium]
MPKVQRKPEEIDAIRAEILDQALELIAEAGYKGFSMRKLGTRLGIAAKTIYNYFHNKDEIYLSILTRGFEALYAQCAAANGNHPDPTGKIAAMCRKYVDFGLEHANLYNLMFTWHVPKFRDYVGTEMEPAARLELETGLKVSRLFIDTIRAYPGGGQTVPEDDARFLMIQFWSQAHGYIAGINNTLLDYMHETPLAIKNRLIDSMLDNFRAAVVACERTSS